MRLLVVEDDALLGDGICVGLRQDGYAVDWITRGDQVLAALTAETFDLLVLDLGLPGRDGVEVLAALRSRGIGLPVLVLTARDAVGDRVRGLDAGADDYMIKPFDLDELSARVRALLRRSNGRAQPVLQVGALVLDPAAHSASYHGQPLDLPPKEFAVLRILLENAGRVVSKARLQESLYDWSQELESNAVEVYVHHVRKKTDSHLIRTIRGVGYLLQPPE